MGPNTCIRVVTVILSAHLTMLVLDFSWCTYTQVPNVSIFLHT